MALVAASQLQVVREFLSRASGEPANLSIDINSTLGPVPKPWQNLAQGGEMNDWRMTPISAKVRALQPRYIRLDHVYSFFDVAQVTDGKVSYDFSKMDPVINDILAVGATPYIALSYMPAPLSTNGEIVDGPKDWNQYQDLIRATIQHYSGTRAVPNVMYEVWNEPDLFGGWKTYGDKNYLNLYEYADRGAKQVTNAKPFLLGGPAITALYKNWFDKMAETAIERGWKYDFFSWHRYNLDIDQYRKDIAEVTEWRSQYPELSNLQLHVTEYGHDSKNHPGYDTMMGAAHTVAVAIESAGYLDQIFPFEIEDGKDPQGQERWGRWGVLTHRDFGANLKPRYFALRELNKISGERLSVLGQGTWVKALATLEPGRINLVLVNYDQNGRNYEDVPMQVVNAGSTPYELSLKDINGESRATQVLAPDANGTITTTIPMGANTILFGTLVPNPDAVVAPAQPATP